MNDNQYRFMTIMAHPPARLLSEEVALILNCKVHDIPVLVAAKLLKPLGNPRPNSIKYFCTADILELANDRNWLSRMANTTSNYWKMKNAQRLTKTEGLPSCQAFAE
jgi:hypothetical protein